MVNVSKRFGEKNCGGGQCHFLNFSLLDPSGCGKTTLLLIIADLVEPDEGEVYIDNKLVNKLPPEDIGLGFAFQTYALFPYMNVWDNVTYGPRVKALDKASSERIGHEILEMVRLYEQQYALPHELSGGMMKDLGLTAIHVTHDQSEDMAISDRIAVMKRGESSKLGLRKNYTRILNTFLLPMIIGENNFLEGHIVKVDENRVAVELRSGLVVYSSDKSKD